LAEVLCRSYIVAGQSVTFACADGETAEKVARHIAGWHFTASPGEPASAFTIHLSREAAPPMPRGPASFAVHHGECFADGDSWALSTGDSWMRIHPPAMRRVDVWIGVETARSSIAFARLLFYATQAALRQCGLYELPPAVMPPSGVGGVLIVGASGSGKTTLAMRLGRRLVGYRGRSRFDS
jgi:ABC-type multidrug transport system fused ATPase/permease subunit